MPVSFTPPATGEPTIPQTGEPSNESWITPEMRAQADNYLKRALTATWNWIQRRIFGNFDVERYHMNQHAFELALSGSCIYLQYLRGRSGLFPPDPRPNTGYEGPDQWGKDAFLPGHSTAGPRSDAATKYNQAKPFTRCVEGSPDPVPGGGIADIPTQAEIAAKIALLLQNKPIGRDGLLWVQSGLIPSSTVSQAQAQWGASLYAPGGALDPNQTDPFFGGLPSISPLAIAGIAAIAMLTQQQRK